MIRPLSPQSSPPSSEALRGPHTREILQGVSFSNWWHQQQVLTLCGTVEDYRREVTVGMLSDNVLLEIFDLCRAHVYFKFSCDNKAWKWHLLAQVCRRWQQIIFQSPIRLNVNILCTRETPVRKNLHIWPAFPIVVIGSFRNPQFGPRSIVQNGQDNLIAALQHPAVIVYLGSGSAQRARSWKQ
jgi:hypothetical protein